MPTRPRTRRDQIVPHPNPVDWPAYWFVALERAVEEGDHQAAAEAQRHLARLGVDVRFRRAPRRERQEVSNAS
jgi:hypothetical protein